ncbi:MAG: choice-of-anchor D domain-containing protein [Proteobacteria bacterium]|nr:choice-of-anchor D domain-containing protein [Pseudomonadota bacterium]
MLLIWLACTSETGITEGEPRLELPVDALDFDEVVIGSQVTLSFDLENSGIGILEVDGMAADGGFDVTSDVIDVDARSTSTVSVRFAPAAVGPAEGELVITSNDSEAPHVVSLSGEGVEPHIDVDPETLWFGDVVEGGVVTLPVDVVARGQGRLRIDAIELSDPSVFSVELPSGVELPHKLESGTGIELEVTFTSDGETWDSDLLIGSNAPDASVTAVRLLANAEEAGGSPDVEITSPDHGNYFQVGETVLLEGVTVDDGGPENLIIAWYADSTLLGSSTADAGGYTSLSTELPEGEVRVTLRAVDGTGLSGEDSVEVSCWGDEAEYVLSGGDSIFDHWSVDDDVVITLNGTAILTDTDGSKSSHAPLAFEASVGDTLRIVATDNNFCEKNLDALVLHWGTEVSQELNSAVCVSSCPEDACYDPDYAGPWPNEFVDESFVIAIP